MCGYVSEYLCLVLRLNTRVWYVSEFMCVFYVSEYMFVVLRLNICVVYCLNTREWFCV